MVLLQISVLASLLMTLIFAQTPKDFSPNSATRLLLTFPNDNAVLPGQTLSEDTTKQKPVVGARLSSVIPFSSTGAYMIFMVDTTAQVLQWFELGLTASETSFNLDSTGTSTSESGAPYLAPDPSADSIHQYVLLLFAQPMGFVVPGDYVAVDPPRNLDARKGFDLNHFIAAVAQGGEMSLGDVIAATYFSVNAQKDVQESDRSGAMTNTESTTSGSESATESLASTYVSATAQHTVPALKSVASGAVPAASAQGTNTALSGAPRKTMKQPLMATILWMVILGQF